MYTHTHMCSCSRVRAISFVYAFPLQGMESPDAEAEPPIAHHSRRDLWRCRLCRHGPGHASSTCTFAHSLSELVPPDERFAHYSHVWTDGVDRWFGQPMHPQQRSILKEYYLNTPTYEVPVWTIGWLWFDASGDEEEFPVPHGLPWDYGLSMDVDLLCRNRSGDLPFQFHDELWPRLMARKTRLHEVWSVATNV